MFKPTLPGRPAPAATIAHLNAIVDAADEGDSKEHEVDEEFWLQFCNDELRKRFDDDDDEDDLGFDIVPEDMELWEAIVDEAERLRREIDEKFGWAGKLITDKDM